MIDSIERQGRLGSRRSDPLAFAVRQSVELQLCRPILK